MSLYKNDPITGPSPSPKVKAASRYPMYLIFWSGSSIINKLRQGTADIVLVNPCNDLKMMATITISVFPCISVTSPKHQMHALIDTIPR